MGRESHVMGQQTCGLQIFPMLIVSDFASYGRNFLKLNLIIMYSQHSKCFRMTYRLIFVT